jgi:hypothetical protein
VTDSYEEWLQFTRVPASEWTDDEWLYLMRTVSSYASVAECELLIGARRQMKGYTDGD